MFKKTLFFLFFFFGAAGLYAQENCTNGIDDDADGLIDMNDPDCDCNGLGGGSTAVTSLIPNPSFEDYTCCPNGVSDLGCAVTWQQASNATSDYFNTCGYTGIFNSPNLPLPGAPGGAGYAGFYSNPNWEENIGACLTGPMLAGTAYTMDFNMAWSTGSQTLDLSVYGTPNCGDLPWGTSTCAVGSGSWILLGFVTVTFPANQSWQQVSINFTPPVNINAVSIGGPCGGQQAGTNYYFLDELTLATSSSFNPSNITETGSWCTNDLALNSTIDTTGGTWQWYDAGVALAGETDSIMDMMTYGPGDYTAVYTVGGECESSDYTLTIPNAPVADFTFTDECENIAYAFTDASTIGGGTITAWDWDFDDGNTSAVQDPGNTYTSPGTYSVSLTATDDNGCTNTSTQTITVYPEPVSDLDFVINGSSSAGGLTGGCLVDDISFVNNSTVTAPDNITAWDWDFGDLTTSNLQNPPDHNYAAVGSYTIELTTTTNNGCENIFQIPITIFPSPIAAFTVPDDCEENAAQFTDGSSITTGSITNWEWDFGDGNTSTTQSPSNLYGTSGTYTVELVVTSDIGCTDTVLGSTVRFPKPLASFTVADVCEYDPAVVTDNSVVALPDNVSGWTWDFGDGNPGAGASANNTYSTYGPYDITLTATSTNGCVDDTTITVNIQAQPIPDFSTSPICVNTPPTVFVDMSAIGNGSMSQFDWDFGDATTGTGQGTTHTYGTDGIFNANLTVTSAFGCVNSVTKPVTVYEKPIANFMADSTYGCSPVNILFQDLSLSPSTTIDSWEWDFFGGNGTAGPNPVASYINDSSTPDLYDVGLIVTNGFGCKDTVVISDYIEIFPTPEARFTFSPNVLTITESETTFNNGSVTADEYSWDFGDNSIPSTSENPTHTFPDNIPGEYLVELIAYNFGKTCSDTTWQLVKVQDIIIFYVPNMFTPDGDEFNETWKPIFYSGYDIFDFHLTVFNRWGELVWESFDASKEWDGHYGNGGLVDDGAYIWSLDFKETMSDKRHQHNGHVTVVK